MSLSDTIDAIIKESSSVERELRWFLSALPVIVSTELAWSQGGFCQHGDAQCYPQRGRVTQAHHAARQHGETEA